MTNAELDALYEQEQAEAEAKRKAQRDEQLSAMLVRSQKQAHVFKRPEGIFGR